MERASLHRRPPSEAGATGLASQIIKIGLDGEVSDPLVITPLGAKQPEGSGDAVPREI